MVICPKCKEIIHCLNNFQSGENRYAVSLYPDKKTLRYENEEFQHDSKVNDYECQNCGEALFTDEESALKFLKKCDNCKKEFDKKINLKINGEEYYFCSEECKDDFKVKKMAEEL